MVSVQSNKEISNPIYYKIPISSLAFLYYMLLKFLLKFSWCWRWQVETCRKGCLTQKSKGWAFFGCASLNFIFLKIVDVNLCCEFCLVGVCWHLFYLPFQLWVFRWKWLLCIRFKWGITTL